MDLRNAKSYPPTFIQFQAEAEDLRDQSLPQPVVLQLGSHMVGISTHYLNNFESAFNWYLNVFDIFV